MCVFCTAASSEKPLPIPSSHNYCKKALKDSLKRKKKKNRKLESSSVIVIASRPLHPRARSRAPGQILLHACCWFGTLHAPDKIIARLPAFDCKRAPRVPHSLMLEIKKRKAPERGVLCSVNFLNRAWFFFEKLQWSKIFARYYFFLVSS